MRLLIRKKSEAELINELSINLSGDIRKFINGIILARENVSKKPLINIRINIKENCLFLLRFNTLQISINICTVDMSELFCIIFFNLINAEITLFVVVVRIQISSKFINYMIFIQRKNFNPKLKLNLDVNNI